MAFDTLSHWNEDNTVKLGKILTQNKPIISGKPGLRRAGVLLPLYVENEMLKAIYIRRTRHYQLDGREAIHSGQIALPGGKVEKGETLVETALRESAEEVGLGSGQVSILGELGEFVTLTSRITSTVFVGWLQKKPALVRNESEVAAIYHIPLMEIIGQHRPEIDLRLLENKLALHYHWQPPKEQKPICIWGMTARVTRHLFSLLEKID